MRIRFELASTNIRSSRCVCCTIVRRRTAFSFQQSAFHTHSFFPSFHLSFHAIFFSFFLNICAKQIPSHSHISLQHFCRDRHRNAKFVIFTYPFSRSSRAIISTLFPPSLFFSFLVSFFLTRKASRYEPSRLTELTSSSFVYLLFTPFVRLPHFSAGLVTVCGITVNDFGIFGNIGIWLHIFVVT